MSLKSYWVQFYAWWITNISIVLYLLFVSLKHFKYLLRCESPSPKTHLLHLHSIHRWFFLCCLFSICIQQIHFIYTTNKQLQHWWYSDCFQSMELQIIHHAVATKWTSEVLLWNNKQKFHNVNFLSRLIFPAHRIYIQSWFKSKWTSTKK